MTGRQIEKARKELGGYSRWSEWTDEQRRSAEELDCRDMINSILCYDGPDNLENDEYLVRYIEKLGAGTVKRLCDEQLADFKNAIVKQGVFKDGEGIWYNGIVWADEVSLDDKLNDANNRSVENNNKSGRLQIVILQVKEGEKYALERFSPLRYFENGVESIKFESYDKVYSYCEKDSFDFSNEKGCMDFLEGVYTTFNLHHPEDFTGRSLSVSDVVVLSDSAHTKAFYCDSFGFAELPDKFVEGFVNSFGAAKEHESVDFDI